MSTDLFDLSGDGGVRKRILKDGEGDDKPRTRDQVQVHYVGRLPDGTVFERSFGDDEPRHARTPFTFLLGSGTVIAGWNIAVASMRKGEHAEVVVRSDYAYGPDGFPPTIPPNATLTFVLEVDGWGMHVVSGSGGAVRWREDVQGEGWRTPDENDEVCLTFESVDWDTATTPTGKRIWVHLGCGQLPSGVEMTLTKEFHRGTTGTIMCGPGFAAGFTGQDDRPVRCTVTLVDWRKAVDVRGDGGMVARCLASSGVGYVTVTDGSVVIVVLEGFVGDAVAVEDGTATRFEGPLERQIVVGDGEVPEGLDEALVGVMKDRETVITLQPKYAFGDSGREGVPGGAVVSYRIKVTTVSSVFNLPPQGLVELARRRREQGNDRFKLGDNQGALVKYRLALDKVKGLSLVDESDAALMRQEQLLCHLNAAIAHKKLGDLSQTIAACDLALAIAPRNPKALFRRGCARLALAGDEDKGRADLRRAVEEDSSIEGEVAKILQEADRREAKLFAKMVRGVGK